jgi:hypothetical protein
MQSKDISRAKFHDEQEIRNAIACCEQNLDDIKNKFKKASSRLEMIELKADYSQWSGVLFGLKWVLYEEKELFVEQKPDPTAK